MRYIYLLLLSWLLFSLNSYAGDRVYVSDTFRITLRTGPGTEYKIIAFLPSGEPLQLISSEGEWSRVKPLNPRYAGEGWVLNRFIMKRRPYKLAAQDLKKENSKLKQEVSDLTKQLKEKISSEKALMEKIKSISQLYQELKDRHEALKRDSADYLSLKNRYEKSKKRLEKIKAETDRLRKENEHLKRSQAHRWFLMGAFVLFSGIILGLILGRQRSRRRPLYY